MDRVAELDLRKVRSFLVLAEHLHFGRAAEQLHLTQPALTRQVQALERELGCELLRRTSRSVELTPAGRQLADDAGALLGSASAVARRVSRAAEGQRALVLGHPPGVRVAGVVRAFAERRPDVRLELVLQEWWQKEGPLHEGRVDLAVLRTPFEAAGLRVVPVGEEPRLLCVPSGHWLAGADKVRMADLRGEPLLDASSPPLTSSAGGKFELVAAGQVIVLVPFSVALAHVRPGVVHREVIDADPVHLCLATVATRDDGALDELLEVASRKLTSGAATPTRPAAVDR